MLSSMLRIEVDFPESKMVNLIDEYQEFLEDNGLNDARENQRQK